MGNRFFSVWDKSGPGRAYSTIFLCGPTSWGRMRDGGTRFNAIGTRETLGWDRGTPNNAIGTRDIELGRAAMTLFFPAFNFK